MKDELKIKGKLHSIETFSALDGPGIRVVIFLQGCFLKCIYCHNPDSWDMKNGEVFTVFEVVNKVLEYKSYIKNGGVTISGGEPLLQKEFTSALLKQFKKEKIHTAIETAGSTSLANSKEILNNTDLVILDLKGIDIENTKIICSLKIENLVDTLKYCDKIKKKLWVRYVLVPGYTLKNELLEEIAAFLQNFKTIERVELLPFHKMGEFKYEKLKIDYKLSKVQPPSKNQVENSAKIFKKFGFDVVF